MLWPIRNQLKFYRTKLLDHVPKFGYANLTVRWWRDRKWMVPFKEHLRFDGRAGTRILDKRFMIIELAKSVAEIRGSTAECGVAGGTGSALICETLSKTYADNELHFAFDSFEGVSEPSIHDRMPNGACSWYKGKLQHSFQRVQRRLSVFPRCRVARGWIPDCFTDSVRDERFRFVHIDVDLYDPTHASLDFFFRRLAPGGIILLDDYGFLNCPGARKAASDFFQDKPESIVEMTTGQAFVVKAA